MKAILATIIATLAVVPAFAAQPTMSVNVTNTPLPVTVTNATTNQSVTVTNGNTNPIPVSLSSAEQPFQAGSFTGDFAVNLGERNLVTVPAGKMLVIEHVSGLMNSFGPNGLLSVGLRSGSVTGVGDAIDCHQTGADTSNHLFACSATTKFYATAGETVIFDVFTVDAVGGSYSVFISGHYVPVP